MADLIAIGYADEATAEAAAEEARRLARDEEHLKLHHRRRCSRPALARPALAGDDGEILRPGAVEIVS
jgi:hypothetical protein